MNKSEFYGVYLIGLLDGSAIGGLLVLTFLALLLICFLVVGYCRGKGYKFLMLINTLVLAFTFIGLLFYTYETHQLRIQAEKQTAATYRPILFGSLSERKDMSAEFEIANLGNGTAVNVHGYLWRHGMWMNNRGDDRYMRVEIVGSGDSIKMLFDERRTSDVDQVESRYSDIPTNGTVLIIEYDDIVGATYCTKQFDVYLDKERKRLQKVELGKPPSVD